MSRFEIKDIYGAEKLLTNVCHVIFCGMWLFIGFVSAYDIYVSVALSEILPDNEENPIGRWLIEKDGGKIALFMGLKVAGTITALCILVLLYRFRENWAWLAIFTLSIIQLFVLWYMNYSC